MDISTSLDYLIEVLEREAGKNDGTLPEKYTSNDIASKVIYIAALFNTIYSEDEEEPINMDPVS